MLTVPASLPQAVTPAAGVTTKVPAIDVADAFTVAEICSMLAPPFGSAELSVRFSVLPVKWPLTVVFVPKHGEPKVNSMLVPVTLPSAFCCNTTENASAGVPVVVVRVATQVPLMADCAVGVVVVVPPMGVIGTVGIAPGAMGEMPGVVPVGTGIGCIPDVGNGAVGNGVMPGIFGIGLMFGVGVGTAGGVVDPGVGLGVGVNELTFGIKGDATLPPQPVSTRARKSSQAEASFTLASCSAETGADLGCMSRPRCWPAFVLRCAALLCQHPSERKPRSRGPRGGGLPTRARILGLPKDIPRRRGAPGRGEGKGPVCRRP